MIVQQNKMLQCQIPIVSQLTAAVIFASSLHLVFNRKKALFHPSPCFEIFPRLKAWLTTNPNALFVVMPTSNALTLT